MISTHILDTSLGNPASGVEVVLEKRNNDIWVELAKDKTNADGRIAFAVASQPGDYRLQFHVAAYFEKQGLVPFFIEAPVTFRISDVARKYHVPLLLNPFGYSTYRGS